MQEALERPTFVDELNQEIITTLPGVTIEDMSVDADASMKVVITIDATDATEDVEDTSAEIISQFESDEISAVSECNTYFQNAF